MKIEENFMYSKTHEWVKVDGTKAYIGLSDYAQIHMGEIVFVDLPETGSKINAEDQIAEVESVKSVAEVYSPVSGSVIKVNEELFDNPGAINKDAYSSFLAIVEMSDPIELDNLLSAPEYAKYCKELREEEKH